MDKKIWEDSNWLYDVYLTSRRSGAGLVMRTRGLRAVPAFEPDYFIFVSDLNNPAEAVRVDYPVDLHDFVSKLSDAVKKYKESHDGSEIFCSKAEDVCKDLVILEKLWKHGFNVEKNIFNNELNVFSSRYPDVRFFTHMKHLSELPEHINDMGIRADSTFQFAASAMAHADDFEDSLYLEGPHYEQYFEEYKEKLSEPKAKFLKLVSEIGSMGSGNGLKDDSIPVEIQLPDREQGSVLDLKQGRSV